MAASADGPRRQQTGSVAVRPLRHARTCCGAERCDWLRAGGGQGRSSAKPGHKETEHASKEPFGNIPKGPLQIFVSIDQQKLHLYSRRHACRGHSVATGVPSLPTPLGVFSVIQKQVFHRSNIYSNAPMPFMQRITWSGVALHEGENIGHRASHGCIRMPHDFAVRLYQSDQARRAA